MRRISMLVLTVLVLAVGLALPAAAGGGRIAPDAIWADGETYGTFGAASALPANAPAHSFDRLFLVPGQKPVAEAAPGLGYNGGRWLPTPVTWTATPRLITSYAELMAAVADGDLVIGAPDSAAAFLCPLIPNH